MNDKRNWKTPTLNPLSAEGAEGAVIPAHYAMGGGAKSIAGATEQTMAMRPVPGVPMDTYYTHAGPS